MQYFKKLELKSQLTKDVLMVLSFISLLMLFENLLNNYLSGLSNPAPFKFFLVFSMTISFFYDLKSGMNRYSYVNCLTTLIVFCLGVYCAVYIREQYIMILEELKQVPDIEQVGEEYIRALNNKAVGIGACYAAGVAIFRISIFNLLSLTLKKLLISNPKNAPCPSCGQPIH